MKYKLTITLTDEELLAECERRGVSTKIMPNFKTKEILEKSMEIRWKKLQADCPNYNLKWLDGMHELLDWYNKQLKTLR